MATDSARTSTVRESPSWNPYDALFEGVRVARSQPIVVGLFLIASAAYGLVNLIDDRIVEDPLLAGLSAFGAIVIATAVLGLTHRYAAVARYGGPTDLKRHLRAMAWYVPMVFALDIAITVGVLVVVAVPYLFAVVTNESTFLLMGIPVAVYVVLRLSLAYPAVTIDRQNPIRALVYSWQAAEGQVLRLLVIAIVGVGIGALEHLSGLDLGTSVTYATVMAIVGVANCFVQLGFVHAHLETAGAPEWTDRE